MIPLSKLRSHFVSPGSHLRSHDVSSRRSKKPAGWSSFKEKGMSYKLPHSFPKRIQQKHKGIV